MQDDNQKNHEAKGFAGLSSLVTDVSQDTQPADDVVKNRTPGKVHRHSSRGMPHQSISEANSGHEKGSSTAESPSGRSPGIWIFLGGIAIVFFLFLFSQADRSPSAPSSPNVVSQTSAPVPKFTAPAPKVTENIPDALLEMVAAAKSGDEKRLGAAKQTLERSPKPARPTKEITKVARQKNAEGTKLLNKGDWNGAIKAYREGREADPGDVEIADNLGFALTKAGQYDEAARILIVTLTMSPTRANSWMSFGSLLAAERRTEDAAAAFSNALRYSKSPKKTTDFLQKLARENSNEAVRLAANQAVSQRVSAAVAEPLRPVLSKLAATAAPLYLPAIMELRDYQGVLINLYALDNDQFPLTANANGYEVWFGSAPDCKAQSCLVGILYSNLGELSVEADEWVDLHNGSRGAFLKGSEKQPDSIVVQKGNFNYGFEFRGQDSKAANTELANSALRLGLLPQVDFRSMLTAGRALPVAASSAAVSIEPTVALDAHKKMTSNFVRNVMKGLGSPIDRRRPKTSRADEPSYPDQIDSNYEEVALQTARRNEERANGEKTGYLANAPLTHDQGRSSFTVNNSRNDFGTLVKLYQSGSREPSRIFYVKAGDSFTAEKLDAGSYVMRYKNLRSDEIFETNPFSLREIPSYDSVQFSRVTVTLYQVAGGNLHMKRANPADF